MTVFVDTFALIAWLNPRDEAHQRVVDYLDAFKGRFVTTEWVLIELADALSAPQARGTVVEFLNAVRSDSAFAIVGYDSNVCQAGFELFAARPDKYWSLTDCISFAVMSECGVTDALTADHHFEQAGFAPCSFNIPLHAHIVLLRRTKSWPRRERPSNARLLLAKSEPA